MRRYEVTLNLHLAPLVAKNPAEVERIINGYVDLLANATAEECRLNGQEVTWPDVSWDIVHVSGEITQ